MEEPGPEGHSQRWGRGGGEVVAGLPSTMGACSALSFTVLAPVGSGGPPLPLLPTPCRVRLPADVKCEWELRAVLVAALAALHSAVKAEADALVSGPAPEQDKPSTAVRNRVPASSLTGRVHVDLGDEDEGDDLPVGSAAKWAGYRVPLSFPIGSVVVGPKQRNYLRVAAQNEGVCLEPEGLAAAEGPVATAKWSCAGAGGRSDVLCFRLYAPELAVGTRGVLAWIAHRFAHAGVPVPHNDQGRLLMRGLLPSDIRQWLGQSFLGGDGIRAALEDLCAAFLAIFSRADPISAAFKACLPTFAEALSGRVTVPVFLSRWSAFAGEYNTQAVARLRSHGVTLTTSDHLRVLRGITLPDMYLLGQTSSIHHGGVGGGKLGGSGGTGGPSAKRGRAHDDTGGDAGEGGDRGRPTKLNRARRDGGEFTDARPRGVCFQFLAGRCPQPPDRCKFSHDPDVVKATVEKALSAGNGKAAPAGAGEGAGAQKQGL